MDRAISGLIILGLALVGILTIVWLAAREAKKVKQDRPRDAGESDGDDNALV